jgi:hypothetical protein
MEAIRSCDQEVWDYNGAFLHHLSAKYRTLPPGAPLVTCVLESVAEEILGNRRGIGHHLQLSGTAGNKTGGGGAEAWRVWVCVQYE